MLHFWKHYISCLIWLLLSEILCLILAFSFAILSAAWIRWLSLACGVLAHVLLMGNCGRSAAQKDLAVYHTKKRKTSLLQPLLLGIGTALPLVILWLILKCNADSSLMLNLFLLLNAPYIQYHRLILDGAEPFSAVSRTRQLLMLLPPILTCAAVFIGYQFHYQREKAEFDVRKNGADPRA